MLQERQQQQRHRGLEPQHVLWVFKTVWSGWDSGCEVGGVETAVDLIV